MRLHNFIQCTYTFTTRNARDYYLSVLLAHQHRLYVLVLSIAGTKHGVHFDVIRLRPLHVIAASRSVPLFLFMSKSEYDVRQCAVVREAERAERQSTHVAIDWRMRTALASCARWAVAPARRRSVAASARSHVTAA